MKPLVYLKNQLGFALGEGQALDAETKDWYKAAAVEEMEALGLTVAA